MQAPAESPAHHARFHLLDGKVKPDKIGVLADRARRKQLAVSRLVETGSEQARLLRDQPLLRSEKNVVAVGSNNNASTMNKVALSGGPDGRRSRIERRTTSPKYNQDRQFQHAVKRVANH